MTTLFFDLDGTLTNPREGITRSYQHALETVGAPVPSEDELSTWIGPPIHSVLRRHLAGREALVTAALAAYRERYARVGMFETFVYPGVLAGLPDLVEQGFRLFVATSKPTVIARAILRHFELSPYFTKVYGSELDGTRSDKAELIAHALGLEGVAPTDALMIGDRSHDVLGAKANAVSAWGVLWGFGSREELMQAGAASVVASWSELMERLSPP